ncbi:hypothetical protein J4558_14895 [Leptolyngbya sp. 15MV]|nr:hypothetical protein J4558_14895 [Leptolyngbya sp. 15MV]
MISVAPQRDYAALIERARAIAADDPSRQARMTGFVDACWSAFGAPHQAGGVSWIGFYLKTPGQDEMILGPRRDKPACSPIGMHGMCGRGWIERRGIVVEDVRRLGAGYIACDPKDLSELVVPCFEQDGSCWGVLDADSYSLGAFSAADAIGLSQALQAAGLSHPFPDMPGVLFM